MVVIYMSNIFYGHPPLMSGLFLLNLDRGGTLIHNIDAKRCKVDNDSATYQWHCRLGHIGVKRMKKLHEDGLLESLDYESLDACEPCLMGKMTKTPFSGTMERVTDLLEIILPQFPYLRCICFFIKFQNVRCISSNSS